MNVRKILTDQLDVLKAQREKTIADLNACGGAIQVCEAMLARYDAGDAPTPEAPHTDDDSGTPLAPRRLTPVPA